MCTCESADRTQLCHVYSDVQLYPEKLVAVALACLLGFTCEGVQDEACGRIAMCVCVCESLSIMTPCGHCL